MHECLTAICEQHVGDAPLGCTHKTDGQGGWIEHSNRCLITAAAFCGSASLSVSRLRHTDCVSTG